MPRDPRPYITVDQSMPLHDKVRPLSHRAFRLTIEAWCWSKRNRANGLIPHEDWSEMHTPKERAELIRRGLAHETKRGIQLHDYLEHQLSAAEETGLTAKRTRASIAGNHKRWHLDLGVIEPSCELCPSAEEPPEDFPDDSHMGSQVGSHQGSHIGSQIDPNVSTTSNPLRESSAAISSPIAREQNGGGNTAEKWTTLRAALVKARPSVMWNGWTLDNTTSADEMLTIHGTDLLYKTAIEGNAPGHAKAWLSRWQALDRPKPKVWSNCAIHGSHEGHTCTPCAADIKAGYDPATGEKLTA